LFEIEEKKKRHIEIVREWSPNQSGKVTREGKFDKYRFCSEGVSSKPFGNVPFLSSLSLYEGKLACSTITLSMINLPCES
jgi:hypothetical protein